MPLLLSIVTPERAVLETEVDAVVAPGAEGEFGGRVASAEFRPVKGNRDLIEVDVDRSSPVSSASPRWIISMPSSSANWITRSSR